MRRILKPKAVKVPAQKLIDGKVIDTEVDVEFDKLLTQAILQDDAWSTDEGYAIAFERIMQKNWASPFNDVLDQDLEKMVSILRTKKDLVPAVRIALNALVLAKPTPEDEPAHDPVP